MSCQDILETSKSGRHQKQTLQMSKVSFSKVCLMNEIFLSSKNSPMKVNSRHKRQQNDFATNKILKNKNLLLTDACRLLRTD